MITEKSILLTLLTKQLAMGEEAVTELLYKKTEGGESLIKEDALQTILTKDQERVTLLKNADKTAIYDKAFAEAKKEVLSKEEKKLAEKYGVEAKPLNELIENVLAKEGKGGKTEPLTEEAIKKHPVFLSFEQAKNAEIQAAKTEAEANANAAKATYERAQRLNEVKSRAASIFASLNPILSKDAEKADRQKNIFFDMFSGYDYEPLQDGTLLVVKDGKRLEDGHGHPVKLDTLVREKAAALYDFGAPAQKANAGNEGGGAGVPVNVPKNEEEYNKAIFNASTAEERLKIAEAYKASTGT